MPAAGPSAPTWTPPWTLADRLSVAFHRLIKTVVATFGLVCLVGGTLWLVPTIAVARSQGFQDARTRAVEDGMLASFVGEPLRADALPVAYATDEAAERYAFRVEGPLGAALVRATRRAGSPRFQIVPELMGDWRSIWDRPLGGRAREGVGGQ